MDRSMRELKLNEIAGILVKAAPFGGKLIQQNPFTTLETVIKRINVDIYGTMNLILEDELNLEMDRPISLSLNYRDLFFYLQPKQYTYKDGVISADAPTGAKALAMRLNERYMMPLDEVISSSLYRIERRGSCCELETNIIDVSQFGLGIIVPNAEEEAILPHDHVWLKALNGIPLEIPIFGRVVYARNRIFKDNVTDIKLGLALENKIPDRLFQELKSRSRLVLL